MHRDITGEKRITQNVVRFESLYIVSVQEGSWRYRLPRGDYKLFLGKVNRKYDCDKVCLGVVMISSHLCCDKSVFCGCGHSWGRDL